MQNVHTTAFILVQTSLQPAVHQKAFIAAMIATPEDYGGFEIAPTEKMQPADDDDDDGVYECTEKEEPPAYETVKLLYYAN